MTPKEVAIKLIKSYVERGDSYESLKSGGMGSFDGKNGAQIGGWMNQKRYANDKILVSRANGKEVNEVFSLKAIFEEIKSRSEQKTLI